MTAKKTVTVRIGQDGRIAAETHGAKGNECLELIPRLEALLEATTIDSEFTGEYYETATEDVSTPTDTSVRVDL